jgi:hypothetical protein
MTDITVDLPNGPTTVQLYWREPLDYVKELVTDQDLMPDSHFHPVRKSLVTGLSVKDVWDEPWTGKTWWDIQVRELNA